MADCGVRLVGDLEIRGYERQLERDGHSSRKVAAQLLGADPERFWLLAPVLRVETAPIAFTVHETRYEARRWTGVWGDGAGGELWQGLHAFPVLTVYEQVGLLRALQTRGQACTLWDTLSGSRASSDGFAYLKVEEGWRTTRDRLLNDVRYFPGQRDGALVTVTPTIRAASRTRCGNCGNATAVHVDGSVADPGGGEHVCRSDAQARIPWRDSGASRVLETFSPAPTPDQERLANAVFRGDNRARVTHERVSDYAPGAPRCRDCNVETDPRYLGASGRCPPCASIASGHGL